MITLSYDSPLNMDRLIREGIKKAYDRKLKPGDVDTKLTRANAEKMWEGVLEGFNKDPKTLKFGSPEQRLMINLRHNVHVTAAFKNHHNTLELTRNLFDENGKKKEFNQFYKDVKPTMGNYNKKWLEAEFVTGRASARMAGKWVEFSKRGGKITYYTQRDGRVSDEHLKFDGITLDVNHSFWKNIPPLRFRCRCYIRWAGHDAPDVLPESLPDVPPMFANNPGKTGKVFNEFHPYREVESQFQKKADNLFSYKPPVDPVIFEKNVLVFNELFENPNYTLEGVDNLLGGFLFKHVLSDATELPHLLPVGRNLLKRGNGVIVNKVVNKPGIRNPDLTINGIAAEVKVNNTATTSAIDNAIREAKNQAGTVILNIQSDIPVKDLEKAIYNRVQRSDKIIEVQVLIHNKLYTLTRQEILNRTFYGKIK